MQGTTSVLAALAASLMLSACAAPKVDAKEQNRVSATATKNFQVFPDPAVAPLADAVAKGNVAAIRALAPKTDLTARGDKNVTLLEWAIFNQQPESLKTLLDVGADPTLIGMDNETVVHMAAMVDPPEYLQILLENKAPVDVARPTNGWTPIFVAVMYGQHAQRDMLIQAGADFKHRDKLGSTLLHVGAKDANNVLVLLEKGVDPTIRNNAGVTFQTSFFRAQERILNAEGKAGREKVRAWLKQHDIPVEY